MMTKKKIDYRIVITAIVCLTLIEALALYKGLNGTYLTIFVAVVAGLAGWSVPQLKLSK